MHCMRHAPQAGDSRIEGNMFLLAAMLNALDHGIIVRCIVHDKCKNLHGNHTILYSDPKIIIPSLESRIA